MSKQIPTTPRNAVDRTLPETLRNKFPNLQWYTPEDVGYSEAKKIRSLSYTTDPLAIAVPDTAEAVAALVAYANSAGIRVAVRSGGNEFFGRIMFEDAVTIDMRQIDFVEVAPDKKTATIGGGIIQKKLVQDLHSHGMMTPFGNTGIVGYTGWATLGGYGPLSAAYGMGFDQIVGAEIVNDKGQIVRAEEEMLEGIRGMGGNLGVIVSLAIKVYPATESLSGMIMYESSNIRKTIQGYLNTTTELPAPPELTLQNFVFNHPSMGRCLGVSWTWVSGEVEPAKEYLKKFLEAGPPSIANTVESVTAPEVLSRVPISCAYWGAQRSAHLRKFTPELLEIVFDALETMPPFQGINIGWNEIREDNPSAVRANAHKACFGAALPHTLLNFSYMVEVEEQLKEAKSWNDQLYKRLRASGDDALMESSYVSLTPPEDRTSEQLFGARWKDVQALKNKYDPNGVFDLAVPHIR